MNASTSSRDVTGSDTPGTGSYPARLGDAAGLDLVAQRVDHGRRGAKPRDTGILDSARELGVL